MIRVEIEYTKDEMERFFRFHFLVKNKLRYFYIGVSLLFGLMSFYYLLMRNEYFLGFTLIIFAFFVLISFPFQVKRAIAKRMDNQFEKTKEELIVSSNEIICITTNNRIIYSWSNILEIAETKQNFYLYITKYKAIIINKNKFIQGKSEDLISLIKENNKIISLYKKF